jgi:hypothetical protein
MNGLPTYLSRCLDAIGTTLCLDVLRGVFRCIA